MSKPTYLSLFSGIGGLDLGLDRAGWQCVGQVEIDPFCRAVLDKHWPEVPKHDDVRTVTEWWSGRRPVDALAGGFPCQGHSVAGKRRGTGDERWGWPWFCDAIDAISPRVVIIENVPNLVRTGLLDVLEDLANRGFDAWWGRIPAAALGAPHLRWRLFVLAAHPERVNLRHEPGWVSGASWGGTTVAGFDGATWALADPEGIGRHGWRGSPEKTRERPQGEHESAGRRQALANAEGVSGELWRPAGERPPGRSASGGADVADTMRPGLPESEHEWGFRGSATERGWWAVEPEVGRVVNGFPGRVGELKALGNAVVPQVAEHVGRMALSLLAS